MLAVQDKANDPKYFETLKDIAKGGLIVQSSTGTMMERVSSGENLIGYNILGSYAETRAKTDPSLGVAYPTDYALVLSRVAFISKKAKNRNAAKLWMEHLYSDAGQIGFLKGYCHPIRFGDLAAKSKIPADLLAKLPPAEAYSKATFPTLAEQGAAKEVITKQWDAVVGANVTK